MAFDALGQWGTGLVQRRAPAAEMGPISSMNYLSLVWLFDMIKIIFYSISYYVLNIGYGTLFLFVCI